MDEEIRVCSMCSCVLHENETIEVNGEPICNDCADEHTTTCDHCGETIWEDDSISDGRLIDEDEVIWNNDLPYCERCYDQLECEIEEYSYKPDPIFYGNGDRYFGVELEVDDGGKFEEYAGRLKNEANISNEHIYIKADGGIRGICGSYDANYEKLKKEHDELSESLANIIMAIEKGIITDSIVQRAKNLEFQRTELLIQMTNIH